MTLHGVAFVTGASQGIGRAIALRLADDGFDIAINDLPTSKEKLDELSQVIADKGRNVCVLTGDVSVAKDVEDMVDAVGERMGHLDVVSPILLLLLSLSLLPPLILSPHSHTQMVANAGICIAKPILESMSYEQL